MPSYSFPKMELHCHLDGSFRPETLYEFASRYSIPMPAESVESYKSLIRRQANAGSVNEYLKMFEDPIKCMQTEEALSRFTYELIEDLAHQGLAYAEIRFAPQLHTASGLSQDEAIQAVLNGRDKAMDTYPQIHVGMIACMMCIGPETVNWEENMQTVISASHFIGKRTGLYAVDLAGAEGIVPLSSFAPLFDRIKELHLPFTCHAGDSQGPQTVKDAMAFGAKRIGHGHHIYFDPALCRQAVKDGVTLEICPTSNVQCMTVPSYEEHPAKNLLDMGLHVTINTDNMFLAGVTLDSEYDHCLNDMGFEYRDLIRMNLNSINAAFCPEEVKRPIREKLTAML